LSPFLFFHWECDKRMNNDNEEEKLQIVGLTTSPMLGRVWRLAAPLCRAEGVELVQVEYQREHGGLTLRLYLDKPGGITLDDCADISRQLGDLLDVGIDFQVPYRLEISSPGSQRPLGKLSDFERFKGCRAKVRTTRPLNGQKNFSGILNGVSGLDVQLTLEQGAVRIALSDIAKAHLINYNGETACLSQTSNAS
jgi:ribosome maturation factor RimP